MSCEKWGQPRVAEQSDKETREVRGPVEAPAEWGWRRVGQQSHGGIGSVWREGAQLGGQDGGRAGTRRVMMAAWTPPPPCPPPGSDHGGGREFWCIREESGQGLLMGVREGGASRTTPGCWARAKDRAIVT